MTYINTHCKVTGKPVLLYAECPALHLRQVARYAATGQDAVAIAEDRYKQSVIIRKERSRKREVKQAEQAAISIEWNL